MSARCSHPCSLSSMLKPIMRIQRQASLNVARRPSNNYTKPLQARSYSSRIFSTHVYLEGHVMSFRITSLMSKTRLQPTLLPVVSLNIKVSHSSSYTGLVYGYQIPLSYPKHQCRYQVVAAFRLHELEPTKSLAPYVASAFQDDNTCQSKVSAATNPAAP